MKGFSCSRGNARRNSALWSGPNLAPASFMAAATFASDHSGCLSTSFAKFSTGPLIARPQALKRYNSLFSDCQSKPIRALNTGSELQHVAGAPPPIPIGVPSQLLERRPDIAAAERTMAEANATIGIATAAYYPAVTLTAGGGFQSSSLSSWFSWPSRFWSVGATASETLFDAGLRRATVQQYIATYNADVASYRQTVLAAFQQVEDALAEVRILSKQIEQQQEAVNSAQTYLKLELARYETGIDPYVDVLIAQTTVLSNQQTLNNIQVQRMTDAVALVEALGGGWDRSQLPSVRQVTQKPDPAQTTIQQ